MNYLEDDKLRDTQRDYESLSLTLGYDRYLRDQENKEKTNGVESSDNHQRLFSLLVDKVAEELESWIDQASKSAGKTHGGLSSLKLLDKHLLAYIGLASVSQAVLRNASITKAYLKAGRTVEIELEAMALQSTDKNLAKKFQALVKGSSSVKAMEKTHGKFLKKIDKETGEVHYDLELAWDNAKRMNVGDPIIQATLKGAEDIFERAYRPIKGEQESYVRFTAYGARLMYDLRENAAWMRPAYLPMLVMPSDWENLWTGAYSTKKVSKTVQFVRGMHKESKELLKAAIDSGKMKQAMDAVNILQRTKFAIDTDILEMIEWCIQSNLRPSKSFPMAVSPEPFAKVWPSVWEAWPDERKRAYTRKAAERYEIIDTAARERVVLNNDMNTASFLAGFEEFYLPYNMDWRTRMYPVCHFNHQRPDHVKALFRFADRKPVGEHGGNWLAIHLANSGDFEKVSKKPFTDRWSWVDSNLDMILAIADDPKGNYEKWSEADSPFVFLQACIEYAAYVRSGYSPEFLSSISVAIDGSCSGLQHFSAMTRCSEEAYHVNLLPREDVGDIYNVVAFRSSQTLKEEAESGSKNYLIASIVLEQGWGRSENKRPTMTFYYGSKASGMRDQYMQDTMRPINDKVSLGELQCNPYEIVNVETGRPDGGYAASGVMAEHAYKAVKTVAPKAAGAMEFFQSVASILAHEGHSMVWVTPTGVPVCQRYSEWNMKRVKMWLYDRNVRIEKAPGEAKVDEQGRVSTRVALTIRENETTRIDKRKARSAASPNVVHSMDGSHMQLATVKAYEEGIDAFMPNHDSFGCHAGSMQRFFFIVRETFAEMYTSYCPFEAVLSHAKSVLSEKSIKKLPEVPPKGDLDLSLVISSLYAFA
jgi:DNA-directed RNA polymerase